MVINQRHTKLLTMQLTRLSYNSSNNVNGYSIMGNFLTQPNWTSCEAKSQQNCSVLTLQLKSQYKAEAGPTEICTLHAELYCNCIIKPHMLFL